MRKNRLNPTCCGAMLAFVVVAATSPQVALSAIVITSVELKGPTPNPIPCPGMGTVSLTMTGTANAGETGKITIDIWEEDVFTPDDLIGRVGDDPGAFVTIGGNNAPI